MKNRLNVIVDRKATEAARSVAAENSQRVFVLFRDQTEYRYRIVDTYDARLGTIEAPFCCRTRSPTSPFWRMAAWRRWRGTSSPSCGSGI